MGEHDPQRIRAYEEFQTALVHKFNDLYGTDENDLKSWSKICSTLELDEPESVETAKKVSKKL